MPRALGCSSSDNATTIHLSATGGTATNEASGVADNTAGDLGGQANTCNAGTIEIRDVNSGDNTGNVIEVGL